MSTSALILPASVREKGFAPTLSSRYVHVDTGEIVDAMLNEGFTVAAATGVMSRNKKNTAFSRHMIDFRMPDAPIIKGSVPRILFTNSHDGSTQAFCAAGLFRFVCSNGLVVGTSFAVEKRRHIGDEATTLIDRMRALAKNTAPMFQQIESWGKIELNESKRRDFATFAATLRWNDPQRYTPEELLKVRRAEDEGRDLWSTLNVVQENIVQGGIEGVTASGRRTTAKPLKEIQKNTAFNLNLWRLAAEFADA